jgi:hypothetical protein
MFKIYWTSEDKQGDVFMGEFATREAAEADMANAKTELLSQALDDVEGEDQKGLMTKSAVEAGSWAITEEVEE